MKKLLLILAVCLALAGCAPKADNTPAVPEESLQYGESSCQADAPEAEPKQEETAPRMFMVSNILWTEQEICGNVGRCGMMDGAISMTTEGTPTENGQSNFGTGYSYQWYEDGIDVWFPETEEWVHFTARDVLFHAVVEEQSGESYIVRSREDDPWYHGNARFVVPKDKVDVEEVSVGSLLLINCADSVQETEPAQIDVYGACFAGMEAD